MSYKRLKEGMVSQKHICFPGKILWMSRNFDVTDSFCSAREGAIPRLIIFFFVNENLKRLDVRKHLCVVGGFIIKLKNEYYSKWYLTLTCIGSPVGVLTSSESSIIFKAMSAIWTAWVSLSLCKPPATQYASPMVSTWIQWMVVKMIPNLSTETEERI